MVLILIINLYVILLPRYDERIDRVETRITARLRDQLGTAKNANEMFRIFSRFNALFVRPHIRGAIREYQTQLMQRVKDDIESLHEKFKVMFQISIKSVISHIYKVPRQIGNMFVVSIMTIVWHDNPFSLLAWVLLVPGE